MNAKEYLTAINHAASAAKTFNSCNIPTAEQLNALAWQLAIDLQNAGLELTGKEERVMMAYCDGLTPDEITHDLLLSPSNVSNTLKMVYAKIDKGVANGHFSFDFEKTHH